MNRNKDSSCLRSIALPSQNKVIAGRSETFLTFWDQNRKEDIDALVGLSWHCSLLITLSKMKMGNMTLWMTSTTFPGQYTVSRERDSYLRLHKDTDCLRTGYLNVLLFPFFFCLIHRTCYLRQWLISIRTSGQGALL